MIRYHRWITSQCSDNILDRNQNVNKGMVLKLSILILDSLVIVLYFSSKLFFYSIFSILLCDFIQLCSFVLFCSFICVFSFAVFLYYVFTSNYGFVQFL